ncbi:MAG: hypothetical protein ACKN9T_18265 [Candidatus Methylumidiphilus sp.]
MNEITFYDMDKDEFTVERFNSQGQWIVFRIDGPEVFFDLDKAREIAQKILEMAGEPPSTQH